MRLLNMTWFRSTIYSVILRIIKYLSIRYGSRSVLIPEIMCTLPRLLITTHGFPVFSRKLARQYPAFFQFCVKDHNKLEC